MAEGKKRRLSFASVILMPVIAFFFDLVGLIPFVGLFLAPLAWIVFAIWFYLEGVSIFSVRRLVTMLVSMLGEMIPFVGMLPLLTISVLVMISMVKSEDVLGIKLPKLPLK